MRLILATSSYPAYADEAVNAGVFVRAIAAQLAYTQKAANYLVYAATRTSDDTLSEVSGPAGPTLTEIEYNAMPTNSMQLYGQGALLVLADPFKP
jgi:hypothetical protein